MDLSWFEDTPIDLIVDTSSLVSERFDFSTKKMNTLKVAVAQNDFVLLTTSIYRGEFLKHSTLEAANELEKVQKFGLTKNIASESLAALTTELMNFDPNKLWEKYCSELKAQDISSDLDWRVVFDDYFAQRPPFSEKKKMEFPDAFNLKLVEKRKSKHLVIISSDPDYDAWAIGKKNVNVFKNLQEFTNEYVRLKDPEFVAVTDKLMKDFLTEIKSDIKSLYNEPSDYSIDAYQSEIVDANVESVELVKKFIVAVDPNEGFATYRLIFAGTSNLEIDSSVVAYDSVDKENVHLGHNTNHTTVEFTCSMDVTVIIHEGGNTEYSIDDNQFDAEEVLVPHMWESFLDE